MDVLKFIKKYEEVLKDRRIPKSELYSNCGFSSGAVSQWKAGDTKPSMRTIENISKFLGIPVSELLCEENKNTPTADQNSERDSEIVDLLRKLTPNEEEKVTDYIRFLLASRKV